MLYKWYTFYSYFMTYVCNIIYIIHIMYNLYLRVKNIFQIRIVIFELKNNIGTNIYDSRTCIL